MNSHPGTISIEELICDETFQQYCLGQNVPSQLYWEDWLARNAHRRADVDEASRIIHLLSARQGNRLIQLKQLREGIHQSESFKSQLLPLESKAANSRKSRSLYLYLGGIAAALVLVSALLFMRSEQTPANSVKQVKAVSRKVIRSGAELRRTSILPDGTVVTLSKNSSLELSPEFSISNREVWLSGEAFFDVTHNAKVTFIVHSLKNDIRVLGTIFNVQAYAHEATNETTLLKGRVEVIPHSDPSNSIVLKPNQKLITSVASGRNSLVGTERLARTTAGTSAKPEIKELEWVRSRLDIEDETLGSIAGKLQNWYGIEIVIENEKVKSYRYSGVFENESVIKTLEALQLSYPFTFKVSENQIRITE